ncbi:MAG TPA: tetratricopeptide repeat protein [Terriglobia bacterium]|nr:tetratricopeptide repeat protein [Terriglobia bacterium]
MVRAREPIFFAALSLALFAWPARAQDTKPAPKQAPASAPEVDPDAAKYSTEKKYVPPGAVKSVEIGNFYLRRKKYNGALSRFKEAVAEDSGYAPAYLGLGKVYEHMGVKQKALDAYKHYLDALPSEKDALEAKNVQHAVARLEQEIKTQGPPKHGQAPRAETTAPQSQ